MSNTGHEIERSEEPGGECITLASLRETIVTSFADAQSRSSLRLSLPATSEAIHSNVEDSAFGILNSLGENYFAPTRRGLVVLVARLVEKARSWGTPQDVIEAHTTRIGRMFDRLDV